MNRRREISLQWQPLFFALILTSIGLAVLDGCATSGRIKPPSEIEIPSIRETAIRVFLRSDPAGPAATVIQADSTPGERVPDAAIQERNAAISSGAVADSATTGPVPVLSSLEQYPNPFSPTTVVSFVYSGPGTVATLALYDIKGQLLDRFEGWLEPGSYDVRPDGVMAEQSLPSGVYFLRADVAGQSFVKKLAMLK